MLLLRIGTSASGSSPTHGRMRAQASSGAQPAKPQTLLFAEELANNVSRTVTDPELRPVAIGELFRSEVRGRWGEVWRSGSGSICPTRQG